MKGPEFLRYINPVLTTLQANGGAGDSTNVIEEVIEKLGITDEELEQTTSNGQSRIRNQIQWARFYLFKAGLIDNSQRGVWRLTNEGLEKKLSDDDVYSLFKSVQESVKKVPTIAVPTDKPKKLEKEFEETTTEDEEHSISLLNLIHNLPAAGFEKLCKRLLTEIGINDIVITGGSGDQGIDGKGLVKLNDVVSLNIVFQCKKYKETVSPHHVRDFRGAMQGRGEKGLIITTGRFTKEAKNEANRDGVTPIELIDGDRLVQLFEKHHLGLKPVTVFEIDHEFFKSFY
ncbi:restriction endonuclease [Panacibacter ginsenosidivorans]|uniref:Restriction endonuclease n=1 Tax=Panacibacter ginsenosidivorans TaxID=1813871 RepID=A0A5B8VCS6_9BACT|nr:restriction endonuclease [Panacibacter ginsenosidivorans]QEC68741.1 restriction endonuclease [Panacibacter ginsenosidivorans]